MRILGIIASSILKKITDTFTRTTTGSLGTTDTGQPWVATRGTWYADGTQAKSDDAASNNSIASVAFGKTDVTVSATVSGGTGPVFWLSDANSWWSAVSYNTSTSGTGDCGYCSTCTVCNTCSYSGGTYPSCSCGVTDTPSTTTTYTCPNGGTLNGTTCNVSGSTATGWGTSSNSRLACTDSGGSYSSSSGGTCTFPPYSYAATSNSTTTHSYSCTGCYGANCTACGSTEQGGGTYPSCSCGTPQCSYTNYNYYLRLLKSVSGTVSMATSDISLASQAAAIWVQSVNGAITAKAYSDTAMATQLGTTMSYTPTSPTQGTSVGIIKYASPYVQGSTLDNFSAS